MLQTNKTIDFIIPVYQNEGSLVSTYENIKKEFKNLDYQLNIIFINDGSYDQSKMEILELKKKYKNIKLINLAKNYGQVNAILAGMNKSSSDFIVTISADQQDPIHYISKVFKDGISKNLIIFARKNRDDGFFKNKISNLVWSILKKVTYLNFPNGGFDMFIATKEIKEKLLSTIGNNTFIQGALLTIYPNPQVIMYNRKKRKIGKSQWTFLKKINYFYSAIFEYSNLPIQFICGLSIISFIFSAFFAAWILYFTFFRITYVKGWLSMAFMLCFTITLISLGFWITSIYLKNLKKSVSKYPLYIEDDET